MNSVFLNLWKFFETHSRIVVCARGWVLEWGCGLTMQPHALPLIAKQCVLHLLSATASDALSWSIRLKSITWFSPQIFDGTLRPRITSLERQPSQLRKLCYSHLCQQDDMQLVQILWLLYQDFDYNAASFWKLTTVFTTILPSASRVFPASSRASCTLSRPWNRWLIILETSGKALPPTGTPVTEAFAISIALG